MCSYHQSHINTCRGRGLLALKCSYISSYIRIYQNGTDVLSYFLCSHIPVLTHFFTHLGVKQVDRVNRQLLQQEQPRPAHDGEDRGALPPAGWAVHTCSWRFTHEFAASHLCSGKGRVAGHLRRDKEGGWAMYSKSVPKDSMPRRPDSEGVG